MNGKIYMHNLVRVAKQDGTPDLSIALTENTVLKRWAIWISGDPTENLSGASDYRIWQSIYRTILGTNISGVTQQSIISRIVEELTAKSNLRGQSQPELISTLSDFYG